MIVVPGHQTRAGTGACVLEFEYVPFLSFKIFEMMTEVCVPVATPSHTNFRWKFDQATKKNTIQKCLLAQTNKLHFTSKKI